MVPFGTTIVKKRAPLATKLSAYRLWFEYLRVAHQSADPAVKKALAKSRDFYAPWGMDSGCKWNDWWKSHSHLFEEKYAVRQLHHGEVPRDPNALLIEVPLTQPPTVLAKRVKEIIQAAFDAHELKERKGRRKATATYRLTEGSELKIDAVREMLTVYRDVYLKNPRLRGKELLEATYSHYRGRRIKKYAEIPFALRPDADGDRVRAMRNLRRYIQKAEKVLLNAAKGQFPGVY